jgi:hypothetical protein
MNDKEKIVDDEIEINWRTVIRNKLFDAKVTPQTIVRLMEAFDILFDYKLASYKFTISKKVEEKKKEKVEGEDELWAAHYQGYNEALEDVKVIIKELI